MGRAFFLSMFFAVAIAGGTAPPALAREPVVLSPSSNWALDYGVDKCTLARAFGVGDWEVTLQIEQSGSGPFYNIMVVGEPVGRTRGDLMQIAFGPVEGASERSFLTGKTGSDDTPLILMHGIHLAPVPEEAKQGEFVVVDIGAERERAITHLSLTEGLRQPITLELGPMDQPLNAMRTCVANLVTALKLDEAGLAEIVKAPKAKNEVQLTQFIQRTYPERMLRNDEGGSVAVQLTVDSEGKATACQIAKSDRPAAFDDYVCYGMLRIAEFEPATGPDGEPRYGLYFMRVTYSTH